MKLRTLKVELLTILLVEVKKAITLWISSQGYTRIYGEVITLILELLLTTPT